MLNMLNNATYIGHCGGPFSHSIFSSEIIHPLVATPNADREAVLKSVTLRSFQSLMTDALLTPCKGRIMEKPGFFFGDSIPLDQQFKYDATVECYCTVNDVGFFLPAMERSYSFTYLQSLSIVPHHMGRELTRLINRVLEGDLGPHNVVSGARKDMHGLLHGLSQLELPL